MAPPLRMDLLSTDVRAFLRERYEQWQTTVPWYRRAPEIVEEAPLYLALERLIRELRAKLAEEREARAIAEQGAYEANRRRYRRVCMALALLQNERGPWRSGALLYREGVTREVSCLGCAGLLTKLVTAEEELARLKGATETQES